MMKESNERPIDTLVAQTFSDPRIEEEYMLAQARLQCSIMLLFSSVELKEEEAEPMPEGLSRAEWIGECSRRKWFADNKRLHGEASLKSQWEEREEEALALADFMWERRDAINQLDYAPEEIWADEAGGLLTRFQAEIGMETAFCAIDRMKLENGPSEGEED